MSVVRSHLKNAEQITAALNQLQARGADMTKPMRQIAFKMADSVEQNFAEGGRPRWTGLAAATIEARTKRGTWPGQILQEKGKLAGSMQTFWSKTEAGVGTNRIYAAAQNFGATIHHPGGTPYMPYMLKYEGKGKFIPLNNSWKGMPGVKLTKPHIITLPAREFLSMTPVEEEEMHMVVVFHLLQ